MPRVYLRLNGSATGCVAKLPESFSELLETANAKLLASSEVKATRVFTASSDEILEEDFELIEHNDVLYISTGEEWVAPPKQEPAEPSPAAASTTEGTAPPATAEGAPPSAEAEVPAPAPAEDEDPLEEMEEDIFEAAGIIGERVHEDTGLVEYLVVWKGYAAEENSWEPEEHVLDAELIDEYRGRMASLEALDMEGLREAIAKAPRDENAELDGNATGAPEDASPAAEGEAAAAAAAEAEAAEDVQTLRGRAVEADAAIVQENALYVNGTRRRNVPPRRKKGRAFDPVKAAERARAQAQKAAQREAERARKEAERQAKEAQRLAEREAAAKLKEAERAKKEAERKAKEEEREVERMLRLAEKEAEKEAREAERARVAEEKEAERMVREAEREAKRQAMEAERLAKEAAKETERLAKEAEREAALQRLEEQKKKRSIFNFGVASEGPPAKSPRRGGEGGEAEGEEGSASPAMVAYTRGGRKVVPYYLPRDATMAASLTSRAPSCAAAPAYLAALVDYLGGANGSGGEAGAAAGAARAPPPPPPAALVMSARRQRVLDAKSLAGCAPWQYAPMKTLAFHEDVRPPYHGTFTHPSPALAENAKAAHEASLLEIGASAEGWIDAPDAPVGGAGGSGASGLGGGFGGAAEPPAPKLSAAAVGRIFGSAFAAGDDFDDGSGHGAARPGGVVPLSAVAGGPSGLSTEQGGAAGGTAAARALASLGNGSVSRRRPFGKDTSLFDYDNDSEAGWEEEGEGEELGSEVDDAEEKAGDEAGSDEEDDFFIHDDADEGGEAGGANKAKSGKLQPTVLVGSLLSGGLAPTPELLACAAVCLDGLPQPGDDAPMSPAFEGARATALPPAPPAPKAAAEAASKVATAAASAAAPSAAAASAAQPAPAAAPAARPVTEDDWLVQDGMDTDTGGGARGGAGAPKRSVTAAELPRLVRLLHGSTAGVAKMVSSFLEGVPSGTAAASKAQIKAQIVALATYSKRPAGQPGLCWQVSAEKLAAACAELGAAPIELPSLAPVPKAASAPPKAAAPPAAPTGSSSSTSSSSSSTAAASAASAASADVAAAKAPVASRSPAAPPTAPPAAPTGGSGLSGGKRASPSKRSSPSKGGGVSGGGISKPQPSLKAFFFKKQTPATPQTAPGVSGASGASSAGAAGVSGGGLTVTPQTEEDRKEGGERVTLDAPVPMVS